MSSKNDIEASVPGFYDLAASRIMILSRGYSLNLHYRMKRPTEINRLLATLASINDEDRVLDAGCGQGGSVLWLARSFDCHIDAVTISKKESRRVENLIRKKGLSKRVRVFQEDMLAMHFTDATFSVVWAIESMCHVDNKAAFVREAYRVLKPGGRIVLADFFLTKHINTKGTVKDYRQFCEGFLVPALCAKTDFLEMLTETGFRNISYEDHTETIRACAQEREILGWLNMMLIFPFTFLRILPRLFIVNARGMIAQGRLFRHNTLSYGIIYAEK